MNILLVENDRSLAEFILEALGTWGYKAEWSVTGADAFKRVKRRYFDLVLMDIFLPDLHGYELIPHLKKYLPEAGIVTMTNCNSRELELRVRKQGITYYMVKPFRMKIIREILQHISMNKTNQKTARRNEERRWKM